MPYVSPGKYTFNPKGAKAVSIKGIDDQRQINVTFTVSMTGKSLPIQLIREEKTSRYLNTFDFPADFNVTFSDNHWSSTEKSSELIERVIFLNLKQVKATLKCLKEQMSLIIMETVKRQDNDVSFDLCQKLLCQVVILTHNLTNRLQSFDMTVHKPGKSFIPDKCTLFLKEPVKLDPVLSVPKLFMILGVIDLNFFLISPDCFKIFHSAVMIYNIRNRINDTTESQKEKRSVLMLIQDESET